MFGFLLKNENFGLLQRKININKLKIYIIKVNYFWKNNDIKLVICSLYFLGSFLLVVVLNSEEC